MRFMWEKDDPPTYCAKCGLPLRGYRVEFPGIGYDRNTGDHNPATIYQAVKCPRSESEDDHDDFMLPNRAEVAA